MNFIHPPAVHIKTASNTDMKFIDTTNLKFHHTAKGVVAKYKKLKFVLGTTSILKLNESFTEE